MCYLIFRRPVLPTFRFFAFMFSPGTRKSDSGLVFSALSLFCPDPIRLDLFWNPDSLLEGPLKDPRNPAHRNNYFCYILVRHIGVYFYCAVSNSLGQTCWEQTSNMHFEKQVVDINWKPSVSAFPVLSWAEPEVELHNICILLIISNK